MNSEFFSLSPIRLLLLDRDRQAGVVRGASPPPTYRSHAGTLLRYTLEINDFKLRPIQVLFLFLIIRINTVNLIAKIVLYVWLMCSKLYSYINANEN